MEAENILSLIFVDSSEQSSVFAADDKSPQKLYSREQSSVVEVTPLNEDVPQPVSKVVQVENLLQAVKRTVNTALAKKTCSAKDFALLQDGTFLETHFSSSTKGCTISQVAKIIVREKLWGITPPPEGLELTITRNANIHDYYQDDKYSLIIKNLCTGLIINIPMEDDIFFDFSIYRGYLFLHAIEEGLFILNLDDRSGAEGYSIETVARQVSYEGRFFLDNTSAPPTMLCLQNCQGETFKITRYGDFSWLCPEDRDEENEEEDENFIFDVIFSKTFAGHCKFEWPTETGVPGLAVDKDGMIWVQIYQITRRREYKTFFCIISPDFTDSSLLEHRNGLELYPWGQGEILLKREIKENRPSKTRKSEYYLLSYRR